MAKIVLSEAAPKDATNFSLANAEISDFPYETQDPGAVANAEAHPWLEVEYDEAVELAADNPFEQLAPEDDVLSAVNSKAFDPEQVRKDYPTSDEDEVVPSAPTEQEPQTFETKEYDPFKENE